MSTKLNETAVKTGVWVGNKSKDIVVGTYNNGLLFGMGAQIGWQKNDKKFMSIDDAKKMVTDLLK